MNDDCMVVLVVVMFVVRDVYVDFCEKNVEWVCGCFDVVLWELDWDSVL